MNLKIENSAPLKIRRASRLLAFSFLILSVFLLRPESSASGQTKPKTAVAAAASKPRQIIEAETLLNGLGYWVQKVDGAADASTRHAVLAFQKVERRKRTGVLNAEDLAALRQAQRPAPKFAGGGQAHIEIDISRQVLFLVDENGTVTRVLPVSTGSDEQYFDEGKWQTAHTPRGTFQITRQIFGIRHAPLGSLYYPNYFSGGVAIHGSPSVPAYPASHGCVRIPNFAAREFQKMLAVGTSVIVYD